MIKSLLKNAIPIIAMIPLLGACSPFQPKTKVIEYDEEVKLHDGSMIWVHIKRHYERSNGREISNWFQGYEKGWGAKEVEISWDTGFPNVGRKSVFFQEQIFTLDKINNYWFVYGGSDNQKNTLESGTINCNSVGTMYFNNANCLVKINSSGQFIKPILEDIQLIQHGNILYSYNFEFINSQANRKLSWENKIALQSSYPLKSQMVGKKFNLEQGK